MGRLSGNASRVSRAPSRRAQWRPDQPLGGRGTPTGLYRLHVLDAPTDQLIQRPLAPPKPPDQAMNPFARVCRIVSTGLVQIGSLCLTGLTRRPGVRVSHQTLAARHSAALTAACEDMSASMKSANTGTAIRLDLYLGTGCTQRPRRVREALEPITGTGYPFFPESLRRRGRRWGQ